MQDVKVEILHIIIEPDGTISGATQRNADGKYVSVSDEELAEIVAERQLTRTVK